jgi:hypothetical protein
MSAEKRMIEGVAVTICQDDDPINPRTEWDNLGTMVCLHRNYNMGDENDLSKSDELMAIEGRSDVISLPIYMYDHSGVTISTTPFSCQWDSGKLGFIYAKKDYLRKEFGWKAISPRRHQEVLAYLRAEVETYDDYLTGNVYSYSIDELDDDFDRGPYFGDIEKSGLIEDVTAECKRLNKK